MVTKMQSLNVELSIPVPEDQVLISKVELQELKQQQLTGQYWSMKDIEDRTNRKSEWIKDHILYPSKFKKKLDANNGGPVFYPQGKGQSWLFHARGMSEFLDGHFADIMKGEG